MSVNLPTSIVRLKKSASRLNALTDEAAATVREVEEFLNQSCSVGIHAWVLVKEEQENHFCRKQFLEYRRVGQAFRIAVVWATDIDPEEEGVKPWSDCSRDEKLESFSKLPELFDAIADALDEKISVAEATSATVATIRKSLSLKEGN